MTGFSAVQAIITAMMTPAPLILAASSLIATVLVRLGRLVDPVRKLAGAHAGRSRRACDAGRSAPSRAPRPSGRTRPGRLLPRGGRFVVAGAAIGLGRVAADRLTWWAVVLTLLGICLIVAGRGAVPPECQWAMAEIRAQPKVLGMRS